MEALKANCLLRTGVRVGLDRRARTNEVPVTVRVVHTPHVGPELEIPRPCRRIRRVAPGIRVTPLVRRDHGCSMGRMLECVVLTIREAHLHLVDLSTNRNERVHETIQLGERLTLGRLVPATGNETVGAWKP